jgi:hypothetical protein
MNPWLYRFNLVLVILFISLFLVSAASFYFMVNFFFSGMLCLFSLLGTTASIGSLQLSNGNRHISLLATTLLALLSLSLAISTFYSTLFFAYWNWFLIGFITLGFGGLTHVIFEYSHWLRIPALLTSITGFSGIVLSLGLGFYETFLYIGTTLSLILHFVFFGFLVVQAGLRNKENPNK